MAQGETCPKCGYYMFALEENEGLNGSWISYECRNESCKYHMKVFENQAANFDFNTVKLNAEN